MPDLTPCNPLDRFMGLAQVYARCRPSYPTAAVQRIISQTGIGRDSLLVDVGSGTGISSRLFAERGIPVIGVEPNEEMRQVAEAEPWPLELPKPRYQAGQAEMTGLADVTADVVLAAQAFHWFQPEAALREFHRILKLGGWAALLWNERDENDAFTAAYGEVVRSSPNAAAVETPRRKAGEPLLRSPLFQRGERVAFHYEQVVDEEALLGRAFSASYAPRDPQGREAFADSLRKVFTRFAKNGTVAIQYETSLYLAQKAG
ncbi:MAG: class I SAM-dependent methyltransferase [Gemmataceae bacterium]